MQKVLQITRPQERLLTTREVADRLDISYSMALAFMRLHGFRPSGKRGGHMYITQEGLHRALLLQQRTNGY